MKKQIYIEEDKNCTHEKTSLVQIMYANPDLDCEFTLRCNDCKKVLGYHTQTLNEAKVLDELEDIMIRAVLPTVRYIMKEIKMKEDEKQVARNLITKIGVRMAFKKDLGTSRVDEIILNK